MDADFHGGMEPPPAAPGQAVPPPAPAPAPAPKKAPAAPSTGG